MNFCEVCLNMQYVKTNDNNKLVYYCKHCSFEKDEESTKAIKISETIYTEDELLYNQHINNYLRFDPTLRRIKDDNIKCTKCDIPDDLRQTGPGASTHCPSTGRGACLCGQRQATFPHSQMASPFLSILL